MKAKRNLLALLLSVVMLWQGFSVVNAEDVSTASESTVSLSSSAVGGGESSCSKGNYRCCAERGNDAG